MSKKEWYKDINIRGIPFRVKLANGKHKYVAWLVSETGNENEILLTRPVRFGAYGMKHYNDKFGYYKKLNHNDNIRLENFRKRFYPSYKRYVEKYSDDIIKMTKSALFWSWNYLW